MAENLDPTEKTDRLREKQIERDAWLIGLYHLRLSFLGLIFVCFAVGSVDTHPLQSVFVALLWALACQVAGGVLGFLFAIPKSVATQNGNATGQQVNTNLEQVADWLTKILLGAGLVELKSLPHWLRHIVETLTNHGSGFPGSLAFGISLMVFFTAVGFMGVYLVTRLYLAPAFIRADAYKSIDETLTPLQNKALAASQIGLEPDERKLSGPALEGAKKIVGIGFDSLTTWQDLAKWGKAQLDQENVSDAIRAYEKATSLAPGEPQLRLEYAVALDLAKADRKKVLEELLAAYKDIGPYTTSNLIRNIYKNLMYRYLYFEPPESFTGAIKYGEEYTGNPKSLPSGGIWVNLACAYGQKMSWLKRDTGVENPLSDEELANTRSKALHAIKQALRIDSKWESRVRSLLEKDFPGKDPEDNDLEVFELDPEFRQTLGLAPKG